MNKLNLSHIAASLLNDKWLLDASIHGHLCQLLGNMMNNPLPAIQNDADTEFKLSDANAIEGNNLTAIIEVNGILIKGASEIDELLFGMVNTDYIYNALEDAANDESVSCVVLYINSPGGSTTGIEELGRKIAAVDAIKPVYAFTDHTCASAAYWLASQARSITMTPSATIGNVGVYSLITDSSEALKKEGVTIQAIASGKYKLMGQPFRALTEEETKLIQEDVSKAHKKFKSVILAKRTIKEDALEGLSYEGDDAISLNFADNLVDSFSQFLTTIESIDTNNMQSYTKQAKAPAITKEAKSAEAIPGVPGTKEDTKNATEVKPEETVEPKHDDKADEKHEVMCPHCNKAFDYPTTYEEATEDKPEDKPAEKKEEYPANYQEAPEAKPEVKPEDKKEKKALTVNDWRAAFGMPEQKASALYLASMEAVSSVSHLPKL